MTSQDWPALRRIWLAATEADEHDVGEGSHDAGGGWTLRAIGSNINPVQLRSHFAIHETTGFVYEERTVGESQTVHITSDGVPEPADIAEARAKLHGDSRGRHQKIPDPLVYMLDYRRLRSQSGRPIGPLDMAQLYDVNRETDRRYRKRHHVPWPPDRYLPADWPTTTK